MTIIKTAMQRMLNTARHRRQRNNAGTAQTVRTAYNYAASAIVQAIRQRAKDTICPNMTNADAPEILPGDASCTLIVFLRTIH